MKTEQYLTFDCGSSTGRIVAGRFDGRRISLEPLYSFPNRPVDMGGLRYWNILYLFDELKNGLRKATQSGGFRSISVDSWGCDFALIGRDGHILQNLSCYRDASLEGIKSEVNSFFSRNELYRMVGVPEIESSTVLRLFQLKKNNPSIFDAALHFLQVADLFNYLLSGELCAEYTLSTTSQLIDPEETSWNEGVFSKLGLPVRLAPPLADSGTFLGHISKAGMKDDGICEAAVYAACCHDSAAVMLAMPLVSNDTLYISSGTWSVVMLRIDKPLLARARIPVFLHEGNWGRKPRLVYNIIGLWMVQQLRRETGISYDELESMAAGSPPFASVFVPEAVISFNRGVMPAISEACSKSGQIIPQTPGDFLRAIYDSLALKYRELVREAEELLGAPLRSVCVASGGARSDILNEATAETTGLPVIIGPIEAAVAGGIFSQMAAHGEIGGMDDIAEILENSFGEKRFVPSGRLSAAIDRAIGVFEAMKGEFLAREGG